MPSLFSYCLKFPSGHEKNTPFMVDSDFVAVYHKGSNIKVTSGVTG